MQQYNNLQKRIVKDGVWIENKRTGKKCKTVINVDLEYSFCPIVTTRKSYYKSAVAEFVGYLRGYTSAKQFRELGTKTWDANANNNTAWLNNKHRSGKDHMGRVYGAQARAWRKPEYYYETAGLMACNPEIYKKIIEKTTIDQVKNVYEDLKEGIDNRGEIITFYNPGEFHMGCLRPCMHTHTFSLLGDTLHLTSYQRSCDVPLGLNFNMVQCYFFLKLMAQITNKKAGTVYHKIVNAHCYEDQYELMVEESNRYCLPQLPKMHIDSRIKTLEDVEKNFKVDDVKISNYKHHEAISYPFSV